MVSTRVTSSTCGRARKRASASSAGVSSITVRPGQCRSTSRRGVSTSMIRPCSMMATRSHSRSASSIRCVVMNTVLPRARMPRTSSQMARRACGSRPVVSSSRNTTCGIVDERQGDEQALLLAARQRHEPRVALVGEAQLLEQAIAVADRLLVERRPQVDRLPHLDALLQVRLLQLHADPFLQLIDVAKRIEAQHRDACRDRAGASPSTHSMVVVLPAPFGPIRPKISPSCTSNDTSSTATVLP